MFAEHFAFQTPSLINFVGGGGKTGLILTLLDECHLAGAVIYTTTTRIHPPHLRDGMIIISSNNLLLLREIVQRLGRFCSGHECKLVITGPPMGPRFLQGVEAGFARSLDAELFPFLFNEADGARSMSLKMPRLNEPVLMQGAGYLVPVIGLDCLLKPLGPETLFRWEIAARHFSSAEGRPITPKLAAEILMHPQGVCRDWRPGMHIIPYINKVDDSSLEPLAGELALELLYNPCFPVDRVVWGSLQNGRVNSVAARRQ